MKVVYHTLTGQTRRFVEKLNWATPALELSETNFAQTMREPFVLIVPTYEPALTELVDDFLTYADNFKFCRGLVGTGNRNFGADFIYTAKNLSRDFDLPLLYAFEFSGTPTDVKNFREVVNNLEPSYH